MRRQGKIGFGNIEDISGKIQIYVAQNLIGEENYDLFKLCDAVILYKLRILFTLKQVNIL